MSTDANLTSLYYFISILVVVAGAVAGVMAYVHRLTSGLVTKEDRNKMEGDIKRLDEKHHDIKERASLTEKDIKNLQDDVKELKNQVKELDIKRRADIIARKLIKEYRGTGEEGEGKEEDE
jgi:peptidoglycan hydrolase CwlO-like protein